MRRETTSVSQEDYLKAIWELVQEEQAPISARLAEDLGVTPPAVTAALKRMTRGGYLRVRRDGHIELSAKGQEIARASGVASPAGGEAADGRDWPGVGARARRGGAVGAWHFAGSRGVAAEALWAREPLPARRAATRRDGQAAAEIWRGAVVGCWGWQAPTKFCACTRKIPSFWSS